MTNNSLQAMLKAAQKFRDDRDWKQYHTPRNLVMNLVREAGEVLECFLWQTDQAILADEERIEDIAKELADVLNSLLLLSDSLDIDLAEIFWKKLAEVDQRYPADEFKNRSTYQYKKQLKRNKTK